MIGFKSHRQLSTQARKASMKAVYEELYQACDCRECKKQRKAIAFCVRMNKKLKLK
jgi:hypothetical protein